MKKPMMKGIDISHWNNIKDYAAIKKSGIDFAIIKAGGNEKGKFYKDVKFDDHYRECRKAGLHVGAYYYAKPSYTGSLPFVDADADAVHFLTLLTGKSFDMPIYIDFEEGDKKKKYYNTDYCYNFCKILEKSKAFIGIYGSDINTFHDMVYIDSLKPFSWWVARYGTDPKYALENLHMHQYSSKGYVPGIVGNVDMNTAFLNFPDIIRKGGFNDFTV